MKTKLLFYAIQKFKNVTKISGIFTFLIIFFMTFTSYSQSNGISFDCNEIIFNFDGPPTGVINAAQEDEEIRLYPYWTGGTVAGSTDTFVLFVQNDNSTGTGDDRWEVHPDIDHPVFGRFPGNGVGPEDPPTAGTFGILYFYSYEFNGDLPSCDVNWVAQLSFLPCQNNPDGTGTISVTCAGGPSQPPEEICDGIDNDGDGQIDEGLSFTTYYEDADEDGYGSKLDTEGEEFCSDPGPGYSLTNDDCDDIEPAVNPGAEEICDGLDNNCDDPNLPYAERIDEGIEDCTNGVIIDYCNDAKTKILVCHNGKDICVSINAMDAHMAHDDFIGSCTNARAGDIEISEEVPASYDVVSWPNPSNNLFNVKMITPNSIDKVDLKTFDINGRLIHSNIINGNEDYQFGEQLSSGIYFVRLSQADITKVIKVIKQ